MHFDCVVDDFIFLTLNFRFFCSASHCFHAVRPISKFISEQILELYYSKSNLP